MNWHDDQSNLSDYAVELLINKNRIAPSCCINNEVHIYAHSFDGRIFGVWVWCSNCGSFAHLDGLYLHKWKNLDMIDGNLISAVPIYQETMKDAIDKHLAQFHETR